jgi:hypothetical protein
MDTLMRKLDGTAIFIHIPKTAGITLRYILDAQYDRASHYKIDGERIEESVAEFRRLPESEKKHIRVLTGHMPFGLHEALPQACHYVTLLRDPAERTISHYYFVLREPTHYLYHRVTDARMTLGDYLLSGVAPELDNGQTRYLSGALDLPFGACNRTHLAAAKQNLRRHFAALGLVERFDESLLLIRRRLGWGSVYYISQNVAPDRARAETLTRYEQAAIERVNALDYELYDYACLLFEEQRACYPELASDVTAFRSVNGLYQNLAQVRSFVRRGVVRLRTVS